MSFGYDSFDAFSKSEIELDDIAADFLNRLNDERDTPQVIPPKRIFYRHES